MRNLFAYTLMLALTACGGGTSAPKTAAPFASTAASASVGGATLQASSVRIDALNPAMAKRYRIDQTHAGVLLLVTVRDADGNAIDPGDLRLAATAGTLTNPPMPLELRAIQTDGMTDYIGTLNARPPATVQFRLTAARNGAHAELATTAELQPR